MPRNPLALYLKDHFAGSEAALEILENIESSHPDTSAAELAKRLRREFNDERQQLSTLIRQLDDSVSMPRRVAGWLSEKGMELKLKVDDSHGGALHLLESIELLKLGVHGKLGLWKALAASEPRIPELGVVEYDPLIRQAEAQEEAIESVRMDAARATFIESELSAARTSS